MASIAARTSLGDMGAIFARPRPALSLIVVLGVTLAILLYQKAFTPVVTITLEASSIGNQLSKGGDVKRLADKLDRHLTIS